MVVLGCGSGGNGAGGVGIWRGGCRERKHQKLTSINLGNGGQLLYGLAMRTWFLLLALGLCLTGQEKKPAGKQQEKPKDGILDYDWVAAKKQEKRQQQSGRTAKKKSSAAAKSGGEAKPTSGILDEDYKPRKKAAKSGPK